MPTLYFTGFGSFDDVLNNPTELLVQHLDNQYKGSDKYLGSQVLEASAKAANDFTSSFYGQVENNLGSPEDTVVVIHFGLDKQADGFFKLECAAYNEATFRCPDEQGWVAHHETITPERPLRAVRQTDIPILSLEKEMRGLGYDVALSEDPGRFICNWLYYQSLDAARRLKAAKGVRVLPLFVHVPPLEHIKEEDQLSFAMQLVDQVCALVEKDVVMSADAA